MDLTWGRRTAGREKIRGVNEELKGKERYRQKRTCRELRWSESGGGGGREEREEQVGLNKYREGTDYRRWRMELDVAMKWY